MEKVFWRRSINQKSHLMKSISCLAVMLILGGCALNPREKIAGSSIPFPELDRTDIVKKWGYPAEILLKKQDPKLGNYIITWVYYIQDSDGTVSPVFFNFKQGNPLATNSFGIYDGGYRLMNTDKIEDLKLILAKRGEIKKTWPVWPD
jgi:hypothetical protein